MAAPNGQAAIDEVLYSMGLKRRPVANDDPGATDNTTLATIEVQGTTIPNLKSFSYTSDALQLGDPITIEVPDPRGKYIDLFQPFVPINFYLSNVGVAGGARTKKVQGLIIKPTRSSSISGGTVVKLDCADLGWHLANNAAPPWFRLLGQTYETLLNAVIAPEKVWKKAKPNGWGFAGVAPGNEFNRKLRQSPRYAVQRALTRSTFVNALDTVQVEPGQSYADLLITYARRIGLLVNVSLDGYLQFWSPDYQQAPSYRLNYHRTAVPGQSNNVKSASVSYDGAKLWSEVRCYSEVARQATTQAKTNVNAGKFYGVATDPVSTQGILHRKVFTDGERLSSKQATKRAQWALDRDKHDAWTYSFRVRGHHQGGVFWESDTMVEINDDVNNVNGVYWVESVHCTRDEQGDVTDGVARMPHLLAA